MTDGAVARSGGSNVSRKGGSRDRVHPVSEDRDAEAEYESEQDREIERNANPNPNPNPNRQPPDAAMIPPAAGNAIVPPFPAPVLIPIATAARTHPWLSVTGPSPSS